MEGRQNFEEDFDSFYEAVWMRRHREKKENSDQDIGQGRMQAWIASEPHVDPSDYSEERNNEAYVLSDHWSIPWADLMMTMFVLFAVLLSTQYYKKDVVVASSPDVETEALLPPTQSSIQFPSGEVALAPKTIDLPSGEFELSPREIFELSIQVVNEANLDDIQVVREDDDTIRISVEGPLFFDLGSAALRQRTKGFLEQVVSVLKKTQNEIHIAGHTDDYPVHTKLFPSNWELSVIRAVNVAKYLIETGSLKPGRFSIVGHSKYRPRMPNITNEHRQGNRRVDIIITKEKYKGI